MAKKKSGKKFGFRARVLSVAGLVASMACLSSVVILGVGMMPTIVAALMDRSKGVKGLTVGAMNLAGCTPFLIQLWTKGNTFQDAVNIITNPRTIIVIYSAAGIGYLIDWALTGIIASFITQRGQGRRRDIAAKQSELIQRWGREVTGEIPLDAYGFPLAEKKESGA